MTYRRKSRSQSARHDIRHGCSVLHIQELLSCCYAREFDHWTLTWAPAQDMEPEPWPRMLPPEGTIPPGRISGPGAAGESYQEECHETKLRTAFEVATSLKSTLCTDRACACPCEKKPSCTEMRIEYASARPVTTIIVTLGDLLGQRIYFG